MTEEEANAEEFRLNGPVAHSDIVPEWVHFDEPEETAPDRDRDIRAVEFAVQLLLSARTDRVRHMRASVAIQILKNELNLSEIANHFGVTPERVTQVVKEVKGFEFLERPQ